MNHRTEVVPVFPVIMAGDGELARRVLENIANPSSLPRRKEGNLSERKRWRSFGFSWFSNVRPGRVVWGKHGHKWTRLTLKRHCAGEPAEPDGFLLLKEVVDHEDRRAIRLIANDSGNSAVIELNAAIIKRKKIPCIANMVVAHAIHGKAFSIPMPKKKQKAEAAISE